MDIGDNTADFDILLIREKLHVVLSCHSLG